MCNTADNARVNGKTGKMLKIPHVPFKNNLLNSEVNSMVSPTPDINKKGKYSNYNETAQTIDQ